MPATARNLSSFNKYKLRLPVTQPIRAWMHPASDVRYFVIMSRAMFIAFLNGRSGGGGDLARISRDTRLLSRAAFRNPAGKKLLLSLFFAPFLFFRYAGGFSRSRPSARMPDASGKPDPAARFGALIPIH